MIKKMLVAAAVAGISVVSAIGYAHGDGDGHDGAADEQTSSVGFTLLEVNDAVLTSLEKFESVSPDMAASTYAFQGQISGADAKVRFFVRDAEGTTVKVNFLCHKHDGLAECHRQG